MTSWEPRSVGDGEEEGCGRHSRVVECILEPLGGRVASSARIAIAIQEHFIFLTSTAAEAPSTHRKATRLSCSNVLQSRHLLLSAQGAAARKDGIKTSSSHSSLSLHNLHLPSTVSHGDLTGTTSTSMNTKAQSERHQRILLELVRQPGNDVCADCGGRAPRWASWNLGIFVCVQCAGVHRKMGT